MPRADGFPNQPAPAPVTRLLPLCLLAAGLPHIAHLGWPPVLLFGLALSWRLWAGPDPGRLPGRWTLTGLTLAGIALVALSLSGADGHLAGSALLLVMSGLKLLESTTRRDFLVAALLGQFLVMTQFLFERSAGWALYLFALSLALLALQTGLTRARIEMRALARASLRTGLAALPTALLLFVLAPRPAGPLWQIDLGVASARTGLSDRLRLGQIGELARSDAVAFRVRFADPERVPPHAQRYWRGPVLDHWDGTSWRARLRPPGRPVFPAAAATALRYEQTLEAGARWAFPLGLAVEHPQDLRMDSTGTLTLPQPLGERRTLRLASVPGIDAADTDPSGIAASLRLPPRIGPRTRALAADWRRAHGDDARALIDAALAHFRNNGFTYTLRPGRARGDAVEWFLFESRRGFCEHYAAAFVTLMRLAGLPARIVTGYQGGERNPLSDHWVVRQSDAHAWAEVWIEGRGWVRVDPTAAIAPERIERGIERTAAARGELVYAGAPADWATAARARIRWLLDAAELGWHRWVLGFGPDARGRLFEWLGIALPGDRAGLLRWLVLSLVLLGAILLVAAVWRPGPRREDPGSRLWRQVRRGLARQGLRLPPHAGPDTLARLGAARWPEHAEGFARLRDRLVAARYARDADAGSVRRAAASWKRLRRRLPRRSS